jgi:hypothetical protein
VLLHESFGPDRAPELSHLHYTLNFADVALQNSHETGEDIEGVISA